MNDYISRQAAIDAFEALDWYHQNINKDMVSGANTAEHQAWYKADDVYKTIEELPPVQSDDYARGYNDAKREVALSGEYERAYQRGKEDAQQWIPCSERLPDERQDVYVTVLWDDYGDYITAYGMRTQFGWNLYSNAEGELISGYTVVAWMPLPKPYKGDES